MHPDQLDNNLNNKLISTLIKYEKKCTFQFPIKGIPKSPEKKEISILMLILCLYMI